MNRARMGVVWRLRALPTRTDASDVVHGISTIMFSLKKSDVILVDLPQQTPPKNL